MEGTMRFAKFAAIFCWALRAFAQYTAQQNGDVVRLEDAEESDGGLDSYLCRKRDL